MRISDWSSDVCSSDLFREDLYYRLNLIELTLPPLHERPADIVPLAIAFLEPGKQLTPGALSTLQRYPWPGNVSELKNTIQSACLLIHGANVEARDRKSVVYGKSV